MAFPEHVKGIPTAGLNTDYHDLVRYINKYAQTTWGTATQEGTTARWGQRVLDDICTAVGQVAKDDGLMGEKVRAAIFEWFPPRLPDPPQVQNGRAIEDDDWPDLTPPPPTKEASVWPSDRSTRSAAPSSVTARPDSRRASSRKRTTSPPTN